MAKSNRLEEILEAERAHGDMVGSNVSLARGVESVSRDGTRGHHERDYQALGLFLLPAFLKRFSCEVSFAGAQAVGYMFFHIYHSGHVADGAMIFLGCQEWARDVG